MIKGKLKINWFKADDLIRMDNTLPVSDFVKLEPFYDVCEEYMHSLGYVLWDDDIVFEEEYTDKGYHELRYNCAVVRGVKRKDKFIINELGIAYYHIMGSKLTDLDKLVHARNNLRVFLDGDMRPQEDSVQAMRYLDEYIKKMRELGVENIKQLLS